MWGPNYYIPLFCNTTSIFMQGPHLPYILRVQNSGRYFQIPTVPHMARFCPSPHQKACRTYGLTSVTTASQVPRQRHLTSLLQCTKAAFPHVATDSVTVPDSLTSLAAPPASGHALLPLPSFLLGPCQKRCCVNICSFDLSANLWPDWQNYLKSQRVSILLPHF